MKINAIVSESDLKLSSEDIYEGAELKREQVYDKMGCEGDNLSPALSWSGAPDTAKSFAITVFDPDAPRPTGSWHWVVFNIPKDITELSAGIGILAGSKLPKKATEIRNDYGEYGYGGACPPEGDKPHRYQFSVYALDVETLPLDKTATADEVSHLLEEHQLARDTITAHYGR